MAYVAAKRLGIVSFITVPLPGKRLVPSSPITDS